MRKVIVLEHISVDGVIQAPGGPDEDTSGGFAYGGWIAPYSDEIGGTALRTKMNMPFDLLVGRKTFDIWAPFWPQHGDESEYGKFAWVIDTRGNKVELWEPPLGQ
jgi:dihydrofolate reductase